MCVASILLPLHLCLCACPVPALDAGLGFSRFFFKVPLFDFTPKFNDICFSSTIPFHPHSTSAPGLPLHPHNCNIILVPLDGSRYPDLDGERPSLWYRVLICSISWAPSPRAPHVEVCQFSCPTVVFPALPQNISPTLPFFFIHLTTPALIPL